MYLNSAQTNSLSLLESQLSPHAQTEFCSVYAVQFIDMDTWYVSHSSMLQQKAQRLACYSSVSPSVFVNSLLCLSQVTEISMGEFLMHSSVVWLNPHTSLGRMRKDPEMTVFGESALYPQLPPCYTPKVFGNRFLDWHSY